MFDRQNCKNWWENALEGSKLVGEEGIFLLQAVFDKDWNSVFS